MTGQVSVDRAREKREEIYGVVAELLCADGRSAVSATL